MRSGTIVGSFKIDLKTVYDAAGRVFNSIYSRISFNIHYIFFTVCLWCKNVY